MCCVVCLSLTKPIKINSIYTLVSNSVVGNNKEDTGTWDCVMYYAYHHH